MGLKTSVSGMTPSNASEQGTHNHAFPWESQGIFTTIASTLVGRECGQGPTLRAQAQSPSASYPGLPGADRVVKLMRLDSKKASPTPHNLYRIE